MKNTWRIEGVHEVEGITNPSPAPHAVIRDGNDRWVALVEVTDEEGLANAELVASAPELLAALKEMYRLHRFKSRGEELNAAQAARDAITKAESRRNLAAKGP